MMECPICAAAGEDVLWRNDRLRVVAVHNEAGVPAFCRVIWQEHAAEMTDLPPAARDELMAAVFRVEAAMREVFRPAKINLASLGNVVPHLHWHVIARFAEDAHFPAPVWAPAQRAFAADVPADWPQRVRALLAEKAV